jgi:hypothetical protein
MCFASHGHSELVILRSHGQEEKQELTTPDQLSSLRQFHRDSVGQELTTQQGKLWSRKGNMKEIPHSLTYPVRQREKDQGEESAFEAVESA